MLVGGGSGRVGRAAGRAFEAAGIAYRIIEQRPDRVHDNPVYVPGDAAELAVLEAAGRIHYLITQNVDGLHQEAGSRRVLELHGNNDMVVCLETFAKSVLEIRSTDRVYSAAKLFFAYGLGNALYFPMGVGATSVSLGNVTRAAAASCRATASSSRGTSSAWGSSSTDWA